MDYIKITKDNKIFKGSQFLGRQFNEKDKNKLKVEHEVTGIYEREMGEKLKNGKEGKKKKKKYSIYLIFGEDK